MTTANAIVSGSGEQFERGTVELWNILFGSDVGQSMSVEPLSQAKKEGKEDTMALTFIDGKGRSGKTKAMELDVLGHTLSHSCTPNLVAIYLA